MRDDDAGMPRDKSILLRGVACACLAVLLTATSCVPKRSDGGRHAAGSAPAQTAPAQPAKAPVQERVTRIIRVPDTSAVVIDLGMEGAIAPGTTFEVYDVHTGAPGRGNGMPLTDVPPGKATIEAVRIMPGYSECHVTRRTPGEGFNIGDPVIERAEQTKGK